jgi:serine/threonine protein kinase
MFGFHRAFGAPADRSADAVRYRAPELFDDRSIDARTDVYGLGMLLYSVLAERPPFAGRDNLHRCALHEMPEPLDGVPAWVNTALGQALAKDPDARFQTIEDFVVALHPPAISSRHVASRASPSNQPPAP